MAIPALKEKKNKPEKKVNLKIVKEEKKSGLKRLGSVAKTAKTTSKYPVLTGFEDIVNEYNKAKLEKKNAEATMKMLGEEIHEKASEYRRSKKYSGTVELSGNDGFKSLSIEQYKYNQSIPAIEEEEEELTKLVGKDYSQYFSIKTELKINSQFMEDEQKVNLLIDFLEETFGELEEVVEVKQFLYPTQQYHENKYSLPENVLNQLESKFQSTKMVK